MKDFLSKHALHSGCAEAVRYAGEMFVHGGTVYLDNGSGTYGPKVDHLHLMHDVLLANFPDLHVNAHPYERSGELRNSLVGVGGGGGDSEEKKKKKKE